jgi:hypothetical protein
MYYIVLFVLIAVAVTNPEQVSNAIPGLNNEEQNQMRQGLESIARGVSDTTNAGLNAFLRKVMKDD